MCTLSKPSNSSTRESKSSFKPLQDAAKKALQEAFQGKKDPFKIEEERRRKQGGGGGGGGGTLFLCRRYTISPIP